MQITLTGSIPICIATGILLLSKGRSFGLPLKCSIAQTKPDFGDWNTACLWHEPVLSALGVPTAAHPEVVTLGGPPDSPLHLNIDGLWIKVSRSSKSVHPLSQRLLSQVTNRSDAANRVLRDFCVAYSIPKEPSVFDLLFEDSLTLHTRKRILLALQKSFGLKKNFSPPSVSHLVVGSDDIETEWMTHRESLAAIYRLIEFGLLEQSIDRLDTSIQFDIKGRLLRLAEYMSLPQVHSNTPSFEPLMSGFIHAIGNTSSKHPLDWLNDRFEALGGRWGVGSKDARRLQFRYHNTISGLSELSELSRQSCSQCEQIWQELMG